MTFTPHPHQDVMIGEARQALLEHDGVVLQSPTGSGKTVMGAAIAKMATARGHRIMMTVHRDFLIQQTAETFHAIGLTEFGIVASGISPNFRSLAQIAAIDTLKNRLEKVPVPGILLIDEAHHSVAAGWQKVIDFYKARGTKVIGLSATPIRLDGQGLGGIYSHMVMGPSVRWLIDNGFLCDYEAYVPSTIDLSGVHSRMGDFIKSEAEEAVDKPTITGDAIREYQAKAPGKRAVVFCVTIAHSQHVCAQFNAAGIPSAHIDGNTPRDERKRLLAAFRRGDILVLTSVDIFGEGFDLPAVEVAILLRPTQSLSLHLQQIGRALRTAPGKERALILDHVGNLMRPGLGLPDSEYEWSLEGRKKVKRTGAPPVPVKQCEGCFRVFWPPPQCPYCGHVHEIAARELEQVDGELVKLSKEELRAMREAERLAKKEAKAIEKEAARKVSVAKKIEVRRAQTLEELQAIAAARGYSPTWAENVWSNKENASQRRAEAQARAYLERN